MALGPEWRDRSGVWHSLAAHGRDDLDPAEFVLVSASARRVEIRLTYRGRLRGGATAIAEHVILTPERVEIEHRVDGDVDAVRQCWPMLATDGATPSVITVAGRTASVAREGRRIHVRGADRRRGRVTPRRVGALPQRFHGRVRGAGAGADDSIEDRGPPGLTASAAASSASAPSVTP